MARHSLRELNLSMKEMEQFFTRMVFNCLAVNQDDHVKNVSFLMDRMGEWKLSPAYDVTFSYNPTNKWLRAHQMSVNGKTNDISLTDLLETASKMGIKKGKAMDIVSKVSKVVADFEKYAAAAKVCEKTYSDIQKVLIQNRVEL